MKIQVTQEDIYTGWPCNAYYCPVALAVQRALKTGKLAVRFSYITIFETAGAGHRSIPTPDIAREFIEEFDEDGGGRPMEFELDYEIT